VLWSMRSQSIRHDWATELKESNCQRKNTWRENKTFNSSLIFYITVPGNNAKNVLGVYSIQISETNDSNVIRDRNEKCCICYVTFLHGML
jgi:glucan phosphorylase